MEISGMRKQVLRGNQYLGVPGRNQSLATEISYRRKTVSGGNQWVGKPQLTGKDQCTEETSARKKQWNEERKRLLS